ncbi:C40 family peptidase [Aquimarina pacifica]|uniref:C40 family peptidase n=1 Tax=Aquimarina pacifica TaxID=1296415 RepID=UPI000470A3FE|nr:C40 family peptidase [Aquimarina pacifica]
MGFLFRICILVFVLFGMSNCKTTVAPVVEEEKEEQDEILPIQKKYGAILGIIPEKVENIALYNFIDSWMETPYKMGGENRKGIDCSFFAQFLYHDVYNNLIERTAEKQYMAPSTDKFIGQEYLKEGDLLFFNTRGSQHHPISHVGIYLGHNQFVHSTSRKSSSGRNGVQISNFTDRHWQKMFVAAGRKAKNTNNITQDN